MISVEKNAIVYETMSSDEQLIRQVDAGTPSSSLPETMLAPLTTTNLSHRIVDRLVKAIEHDEFMPGQKLPSEKELMNAFKVGRSSVREALHSLVALKLVEARAGKGYYVKEPGTILHGKDLVRFAVSERDFLDIMEAREEIEPRIARLAAQRVLPEDLERLEQAYSEIQQAAAQGKYRYTGAIHLGIARATHNPVLVRIMEMFLPMFPGRVHGRTIPVDKELPMHRKLIDGLHTGDEEVMKQLMIEHLRATRDFYVTSIHKGVSHSSKPSLGVQEKKFKVRD